VLVRGRGNVIEIGREIGNAIERGKEKYWVEA